MFLETRCKHGPPHLPDVTVRKIHARLGSRPYETVVVSLLGYGDVSCVESVICRLTIGRFSHSCCTSLVVFLHVAVAHSLVLSPLFCTAITSHYPQSHHPKQCKRSRCILSSSPFPSLPSNPSQHPPQAHTSNRVK